MKIDLSTIALIMVLVVPGLVAKKSRRKLCAQSFESAGAATELGELVGLSLIVHLLLLACLSFALFFSSLFKNGSISFYFRVVDTFAYYEWEHAHRVEVILAIASYISLSVAVGHILGIVSGWVQLNHPFSRLIESRPYLTRKLHHLGVFALLGERPLSFELFSGEAVSQKNELIYFLEIRLRDDKGFITGELIKYAIVRDEEPHRPVVLRDAQFKLRSEDDYEAMEGDRVLIDLADALVVQVSYRDRDQALAETQEQ